MCFYIVQHLSVRILTSVSFCQYLDCVWSYWSFSFFSILDISCECRAELFVQCPFIVNLMYLAPTVSCAHHEEFYTKLIWFPKTRISILPKIIRSGIINDLNEIYTRHYPCYLWKRVTFSRIETFLPLISTTGIGNIHFFLLFLSVIISWTQMANNFIKNKCEGDKMWVLQKKYLIYLYVYVQVYIEGKRFCVSRKNV